MKTLLIMRHAKTQPDAPHGDHARELTDRGHRDAPVIGRYIASLVGTPDAIVTSDARRALQTAELVATSCQFTAPLTVEPAIYGADTAGLAQIVRQFPDSADCVLLVGHNPGMQELIDLLADTDVSMENFPTAGLAQLEHDSDRWQDVTPGSCHLRGITSPKLLAERKG
jgi:phosphohistidine phosphatase